MAELNIEVSQSQNNPLIKNLGLMDYLESHQAMQIFTDERSASTQDQIWLLQHHPVFTLGRNANRGNFISDHNIEVIQSDRGGDVTYHGPGQLIIYCLLDLKRLQLGVKSLVTGLEEVIIQYLSEYKITGERLNNAPGVYVGNKKIASLGLRVRRNCSFHGLAINVDMDLAPFSYINPCGLQGMQVTQLSDLGIQQSCDQVASSISSSIIQKFY